MVKISPSDIAAFGRDGFFAARGLVPDIGAYADPMDRAVRWRTRLDTRPLEKRSPYEQSFTQCQYLWEDRPDIRPLTFDQRIAGTAAALLCAPRVRLWHDQALYKQAGGRGTDAHQDHAYWPIDEIDTITAWIPFDRVTEESGAMGYVPGSHRMTTLGYADIFRDPGNEAILDQRYVREHPPVFVAASPGDVLFHHGLTIHLAKPNCSSTPRRAYTIIFFRDGCRRAARGFHTSLDRTGIEMGAAIEGPVTPIAWPIDGPLPLPAAWPELATQVAKRAAQLGVIPNGKP